MKKNKKFNLYLTKDGLVFRIVNDKLVPQKVYSNGRYSVISITRNNKRIRDLLHRVMWETFIGPIPSDMEIDHINTDKLDNRLENLRCVSPKDNMNNKLTLKHISDAQKKAKLGKPRSEFGKKFLEHYGFTQHKNIKLYDHERCYYRRHGKCRWET